MYLKWLVGADQVTERRAPVPAAAWHGGITQAHPESLLDQEAWLPVYRRLKEVARSTQLEISFLSLGREVSK